MKLKIYILTFAQFTLSAITLSNFDPFLLPTHIYEIPEIFVTKENSDQETQLIKKLQRKFKKNFQIKSANKITLNPTLNIILKKKLNHQETTHYLENKYHDELQNQLFNLKALNLQKTKITKTKKEISLAANKGKAESLSEEELKQLSNKSYIYLPYISQISFTSLPKKLYKKKVKTSLDGGLLWFKINSSDQKKITLSLIKDIKISVNDASKWLRLDCADEFIESAINQSQKLPELKERQHIAYVEQDNYYCEIHPFFKNKIGDEFLLKGYEETSKGVIIKTQGLVYLEKITSQNIITKQLWGESQTRGSWLENYPKLGLDLEVSATQIINLQDKSLKGFSSKINIPLSEITNKAHQYLTLSYEEAFANLSIEKKADYEIVLKAYQNIRLDLEQRYYYYQHGIRLGLGLGFQDRSYGQKIQLKNWELGWLEKNRSFLLSLQLGYLRALNKNTSLSLNWSKNFVSPAVFVLLGSRDKRKINFDTQHINLSIIYSFPLKNHKSQTSGRTLSNILDIWDTIYQVIDNILIGSNTSIKKTKQKNRKNKNADK